MRNIYCDYHDMFETPAQYELGEYTHSAMYWDCTLQVEWIWQLFIGNIPNLGVVGHPDELGIVTRVADATDAILTAVYQIDIPYIGE